MNKKIKSNGLVCSDDCDFLNIENDFCNNFNKKLKVFDIYNLRCDECIKEEIKK